LEQISSEHNEEPKNAERTPTQLQNKNHTEAHLQREKVGKLIGKGLGKAKRNMVDWNQKKMAYKKGWMI